MISLYSGTPGSGKSLHTAKKVYDKCRFTDTLIITNFEVDADALPHPEKFMYIPNSELTPERLLFEARGYYSTHKRKEGAILLIIDECQLIFNARSWNEDGRKEWLAFFSQHRKYGFDVILVAQFDMMIDKQIRSLIEYEVIHRKASNFGFMGTLLRFFAFGDVFVAVYKWYTIGKKTDSEYFKARKKYYRLYDTFKDFGGM